MKIKIELEIELSNTWDMQDESCVAFLDKQVLSVENGLFLHSNEIGDTVGEITCVSLINDKGFFEGWKSSYGNTDTPPDINATKQSDTETKKVRAKTNPFDDLDLSFSKPL